MYKVFIGFEPLFLHYKGEVQKREEEELFIVSVMDHEFGLRTSEGMHQRGKKSEEYR